jgi:hypothetical protein
MLGGLSPIAKVRRSASTAVFVSHWCAPRIYVNCTNHSGFQDRYGCRLAVRPAHTANNRTDTAANAAKPEQATDHRNAAYHRNAA